MKSEKKKMNKGRALNIGIIGAGKVGPAMGCVLQQKGMKITAVSDVLEAPINMAKKYLGEKTLYTSNNMDVVEASDIIAITTQDRAIRDVVREIMEKAERLDNKLFFHTSGAHPAALLSPLDKKGARLGTLHPLQTFPDIDSAINVLPATYIFIEGNEGSIGDLTAIGEALGHSVVRIEGKDKVLYHLSAVFVCNLLCALLYSGKEIMGRIGIDFQPFLPIIQATLNNVKSKGPLISLTGPVVRGDAETVVSHIEAMEGMALNEKVYKALSLVALEMAKERGALSEDVARRLEEILEILG